MQYLIGFILIIVGGVSTALTEFMPLVAILFVGVFMFASIKTEGVLAGYVIPNTQDALIRKRQYMFFIPFVIISRVLTLGNATLLIPYKETYFTGRVVAGKLELNPVSRAAYKSMLREQRKIYSQCQLSREFMEEAYTPKDIGLKKKKGRLIAAVVVAAVIGLSGLTMPGSIWLVLIWWAVFVPMIVLWIPEYKDAKILQQAYDRAMMQGK